MLYYSSSLLFWIIIIYIRLFLAFWFFLLFFMLFRLVFVAHFFSLPLSPLCHFLHALARWWFCCCTNSFILAVTWAYEMPKPYNQNSVLNNNIICAHELVCVLHCYIFLRFVTYTEYRSIYDTYTIHVWSFTLAPYIWYMAWQTP